MEGATIQKLMTKIEEIEKSVSFFMSRALNILSRLGVIIGEKTIILSINLS